MDTPSLKGFNSEAHLKVFDIWNTYSDVRFKFLYGAFQENRFLAQTISSGNTILDVGCATGTTARWLKCNGLFEPSNYLGIDVGREVIDDAKSLYPDSTFETVPPDWIYLNNHKYDVVFCRDVAVHQTDPLAFIDALINSCSNTLIFRLRTRDSGATILDPNLSCQVIGDKFWAPYIVLNVNELVERIKLQPYVTSVELNRSYEVLGGQHGRYLPKELYFTEAGGAETSVRLQLSKNPSNKTPTVVYRDESEGQSFLKKRRKKVELLKYTDLGRQQLAKLFNM